MNIAEILGGAIGRFRVDGIEWAVSGAVSLQGFNNIIFDQIEFYVSHICKL